MGRSVRLDSQSERKALRRARVAAWLGCAMVTVASAASADAQQSASVSRVELAEAKRALPAGTHAEVGRVTHFGALRVLRLEQTHAGLPVLDASAVALVDRSGAVARVKTHFETRLPRVTTARVSARDAARAARGYTRLAVQESDAHLVVARTLQGGKLSYAVTPHPIVGVPTAPVIFVDAETGSVLGVRETVVFADMASVYPTNPKKTPAVGTLAFPMATNGGGTLTNDFLVTLNCIDKKAVKSVNAFGVPLNVHVCDLEQKAMADGSGDFLFTPQDGAGNPEAPEDAFSEVSMYYHATRAYEFFRTLQGDATAQVVQEKPLRTIANLRVPAGLMQGQIATAADPNIPLDAFPNAFFSPPGQGLGQVFEQLYGFNGGALWFGQGPNADFSYDGDVVYHEFGHAVVDNTLKLGAWRLDSYGFVASPGAMNEGLADYFSAALSGDADVGEYASSEFGGARSSIRSLENDDKCPTNIIGEVHHDSTPFSGALWKARQSLGEADRARFDAAVYKTMLANPARRDLGFDQFGDLLVQTLNSDLPAAVTLVQQAFGERGILPECARVLEATPGQSVTGPNGATIVAPGKQHLLGAKEAPGIHQLHLALPAGATRVNVAVKTSARPAAPTALPIGGAATPFAARIYAKFGSRITWSLGSSILNDADVSLDGASDKDKTAPLFGASIDVPEGATDIYVQVANSGDSDGALEGITLTVEQADPPPVGDSPNEGNDTAEAGCGCSVVGQTRAPASTVALLFGLGLLFVARRRPRA